jgi:hypothetical protein
LRLKRDLGLFNLPGSGFTKLLFWWFLGKGENKTYIRKFRANHNPGAAKTDWDMFVRFGASQILNLA